MKTFVVIPTKLSVPENLYELLASLEEDKKINKIYLLNNTDAEINTTFSKVVILDFKDFSIYEMWNRAWEYIRYNYPKQELNIAFLNDDIKLHKDSIGMMATILREHPDLAVIYPDVSASWDKNLKEGDIYSIKYTNTTAGAGGMTGFCFMIKGELDIPYIDENLKLYWGDDDLVKQVLAKGYAIGKLDDLPIIHLGSATIRKNLTNDERHDIMEKDRIYFNKKYGEQREPVW